MPDARSLVHRFGIRSRKSSMQDTRACQFFTEAVLSPRCTNSGNRPLDRAQAGTEHQAKKGRHACQ